MTNTNSFIHVYKSENGNIRLRFTDGNIWFTAFGADVNKDAVATLKGKLEPIEKDGKVHLRTTKPFAVAFTVKGTVEDNVDPVTGESTKQGYAMVSAITEAEDNLAVLGDLF